MEKIDFLSSGGCSNDSKLLLACANGVPYALRLCTNCCTTTATSYINLATGVSSTTPPSGLSIGECPDITCPPIYETESFVATAGQTSFTLSHSPYKDVDFTRNGATLIDSVAVVNGNTVTYVPSENNNINLLVGDDITISYLYIDPSCTEMSINSVICFEFTEGTTTTNIKIVSLNNSVTYYENDVKISDASRITAVEQLVLNANSDNVVCCPDCGGGSDVTVTPCKSYFEKQTFIATAGQTSFTLLSPPNGDIHFSRNGSTLSDLSATVSGNVVTYVPNQNNNEVLLAGDRIDISYVYVICDATVEPFVDCIGNEILNGAALVQCSALDPTQFNIDPTTGEITVVTTNLTDCAGNDLTKDTAVVTCAALNPSDFNIDPNTGLISTVDYTDCAGNELESGTSLVTCAALNPNQFSINPTTGEVSVVSSGGIVLKDCLGNALTTGDGILKCDALNSNQFSINPTTGEISIIGGRGTILTTDTVLGTTTLTVAPQSTGNGTPIPGASFTFTNTEPSTIDISAIAMVSNAINNQATQGTIYLLVDGQVVNSTYYGVPSGSGLVNLVQTTAINYSQKDLPAGTHTVSMNIRPWTGSAVVNLNPTGYTGYTAQDSQSMKSSIKVTVFNQ